MIEHELDRHIFSFYQNQSKLVLALLNEAILKILNGDVNILEPIYISSVENLYDKHTEDFKNIMAL